MSNAYLEIAGARVSYDGVTDAMSIPRLEVARGEFVSFLGPSGSGKTTTLMAIAGFQELTQGEIRLNGRPLGESPPHKRNIGVVFQNYALFPHLTVSENVFYPLRMRGVPRAKARSRIDDALAMVGLTGVADRRPKQLSGGQQQRVALARTLVFNPDLILLDEPLGALDKNLREHMQVELRRIHRQSGVTMIYVTHDQTEAMTMSDRIAVFNQGKIDQIGAPNDIYLRPATHFVASFVGDSNILVGEALGADRVRLPGFGEVPITAPGLSAGRKVELLMRPEIFRLRPLAHARGAHEGIVEDSLNYGDSRLVLTRVGDQTIRARVLDGEDAPGPGDRCSVEWDPARVHLLP